jgi:GT2 family glycosyltransferase
MHRLWETVVGPLIEAAQPKVIVEVGTAAGSQAELLLGLAQRLDAVVHLIDPAPNLDPAEWQRTYGSRLHLHADQSLEALPGIESPDVVLLDGDHNWHTVINELRILEEGAGASGREPPLVLAHDVGWPYGRRDLYYDPDSIPERHRQPHRRAGLFPGEERPLEEGGLNHHLNNAIYEGTPASGVLTAIEDFAEASERSWQVTVVPGVHGTGILATTTLLERQPAMAKRIGAFSRAPFLRRQVELLEGLRLELAVDLESAKSARASVEERARDLKERLGAAEERARELKKADRDVAEPMERLRERVGELLEELETATAARDRAEARAELSVERERRQAGDLEALRAELRGPGTAGPGRGPGNEAELRRSFAERYREVAKALTDAGDEPPVGAVLSLDRLGVLAEAGSAGGSGTSVDVVVCIHDAAEDVRRCLRSLLAAGGHPFHLILVDDGSGLPTRRLLEWFASEHAAVELVSNPEDPHGYTIAANLGLRASTAEVVVLLNSDTVVTAGWLDALVELAESDEGIGVLGPLSNAATHQSVPAVRDRSGWASNPLPDWLTPEAMGMLVARMSDGCAPRVPFVNGFCFAMTRTAIERVGEFDEESFAEGFCEENDYAVRAQDAGFALAVSDSAYVHHAKSRSYGSERRERISREHYRRFIDKHGEQKVDALLKRFGETERELAPLRGRLADASAGPEALERAVAGLRARPIGIDFVLPGLAHGGGGGTHSVYQEARALQRLGARSRVLLPEDHLDRAAEIYPDAESVFEGYDGDGDLAERTAAAEVIVATHHRSVPSVAAIRRIRDDFLPAYYVQDYEPFFAPQGSAAADEALLSYEAIPDQLVFAKTDWLASVLAVRHGIQVAKVEPSIDGGVYNAANRPRPSATRPLRLAAMVRPRTPRRQPLTTLRLIERAAAELDGDIRAVTFGCTDEELEALAGTEPRGVDHRGVLRREQVAELLRRTDVFIDLSVYQAFGRTGLEAMACGATAVLPAIGGAREYVEDGVNAVLAETVDPDGCFAVLADLLSDRDRLESMQAKAAATGLRYSSLRAAISEYALFEAAIGRTPAGAAEPAGAPR